MNPEIRHEHLIIRAEVKNPITDPELAKEWALRLINNINMKIAPISHNPIAYYCDQEGNEGITIAAILETSHFVMHLWDKASPKVAQIDVYSCSELDPEKVFEMVQEMNPTSMAFKFLNRKDGLKEIKINTTEYMIDWREISNKINNKDYKIKVNT